MDKREIRRILKKYVELLRKEGIPVYKAYLYGSYAKNISTKDSDIDILIVTDKEIDVKLKAKAWSLIRKVNTKIEPYFVNLKDFQNKNSLIASIAEKEGFEI